MARLPRLLLTLAIGLVVALLAWVLYVSVDHPVRFTDLALLRVDLAALADDQVAVVVGFQGPAEGRCTSIRPGLAVGVAGVVAAAVSRGGGTWTLAGGWWPVHRCDNEASYTATVRARPGPVGAVLYDGHRRVTVVVDGLLAVPACAVESALPARPGAAAVVACGPLEHAFADGAGLARGTVPVPVTRDGPRLRFVVPAGWSPGDAEVVVRGPRSAPASRCDGVPRCAGAPRPVDARLAFPVVP